MRLQSFFHDGDELQPLEVEIALWPGLPTIQFVGQADQHLRESALRIKSAIKASGYEFPIAQQILVNLRPTHLRKSSRGLELAVALAYLWKTKQLPAPLLDENTSVYGELSLSGEVEEPADLSRALLGSRDYVVTGRPTAGSESEGRVFRRKVIGHLRDFESATEILPQSPLEGFQRPSLPPRVRLAEDEARLLALAATGGHHLLLAGPAGSGKSTLGRFLHLLQPDLEEAEALHLRRRADRQEIGWRPLVEPHHTTPRAAMIGGGDPPRAGEIARAHLGLLMMDEFLEFHSDVLEALREPFEQEGLRIGRLGRVRHFEARLQICATTNLCPCGDWTPGKEGGRSCRFSLKRCRSTLERLSGPLLDRFQMLFLTTKKKKREVTLESVAQKTREAHEFQLARRGFPLNRRLDFEILWSELAPDLQKIGALSTNWGERRRLSALRVARSCADLEGSRMIEMHHLEEATQWAVRPFESLNRGHIELEY